MICYRRLDPSALRTRKGQGVPASGFELALGPALLQASGVSVLSLGRYLGTRALPIDL